MIIRLVLPLIILFAISLILKYVCAGTRLLLKRLTRLEMNVCEISTLRCT
jgi:hypothetical protein